MSVEVVDPDTAAGVASTALDQTLATLRQAIAQAAAASGSAGAAAASQAAITTLLAGIGIPHRWTGTQLQIRLPDGTYGAAVDLKGVKGDPGATPTFHTGTVTNGEPDVRITSVDPLNPIVDFVLARGDDGDDGLDGWSPKLAIVSDGARRVAQVVDWQGGGGSKPASGLYVGSTGLTSVLADAVDVRGAPGANGTGSGTVLPTGAIVSGNAAVFADNTGNSIKDGGPLLAVTGSPTAGHLAIFSNSKVFQDGGALTAFGASVVAAANAAGVKALLSLAVADVTGAEATSNKAQANGYCDLDSGGKVPSTRLPASVSGGQVYQGTWNASTNTPTLSSGTGTKGFIYKISVAGTTTLDGISQWFVGDEAIFNGTTWDRIIGGSTSIHTVAGLVGDIPAAALKAALAIVAADVSGLYGYTLHGDSNYTILATDHTVATSAAFTAPRTWTLPAANSFAAGQPLRITDAVGAISPTNTLTLQRAGSDTVNGGTSQAFASTHSEIVLVSDGSSVWTYDVQGVARGGTGATTAAGARTNLGAAASGANADITSLTALTTPLNALGKSAKSANYTFLAADTASLITCTGTFTLTFSAPATLAANWWALVQNKGTGNVTVSPTSGTIDGLSSYVMYPGEARLFQCDGSTIVSVVEHPFNAVFTSSGTFTTPPGYNYFGGLLWAGGASGAKGPSANNGGGGGGGGECKPFLLQASAFGASQAITMGAGGAAVSGTAGNAGGNSSIGSLLTAYGGSAVTAGGAGIGGLDVAAVATYSGANGGAGGISSAAGANGINGVYGGGGGGGGNGGSGASRSGGSSVFGGAGGAGGNSSVVTGGDGSAPAGGGGGVYSNAAGLSGNGARGELRIWGVA